MGKKKSGQSYYPPEKPTRPKGGTPTPGQYRGLKISSVRVTIEEGSQTIVIEGQVKSFKDGRVGIQLVDDSGAPITVDNVKEILRKMSIQPKKKASKRAAAASKG
jgi:hypothetical protein